MTPKAKHILKIANFIVSLAGVAATAYFTAEAAVNAKDAIDERKEFLGRDLTKKEVVKTSARYFVKPAIAMVVTMSSITGAHILNRKDEAKLAAAYSGAVATAKSIKDEYSKYQDEVKEEFGEDAHLKIMEKVGAEIAEEDWRISNYAFGETCLDFADNPEKKTLFYIHIPTVVKGEDGEGKIVDVERYFESTPTKVLQAEYAFNRNFVIRGCAYLNELFEFLGIKEDENAGYSTGWTVMDEMYWVDFDHVKREIDGEAVYEINTPIGPRYDWDYYY